MNRPSDRAPDSREPVVPARDESKKARIAVADDDPDSLDLISHRLRSPTTEIRGAASGTALVLLLTEEGPFDLVVSDVDMPWMEGPAVIRTVRASSIYVPVLFVTGLTRPDLQATVAGLGNARLLRKPIEITELRHIVAEMLGGA